MASSSISRRLTDCDLQRSGFASNLAEPLHAQKLENALRLEPLLNFVQDVMDPRQHSGLDTDTDTDVTRDSATDDEGNRIYNGIVVTKSERKADKSRLYNVSRVKKSRKWIKNLLLSDSSSDEDDEIDENYLHDMIRVHKWQRRYQLKFYHDREFSQYQYYSVGLLSNHDHFPDHQRTILGPRKISKEQKRHEKKMKAKLKKLKDKVKKEGQGSAVMIGKPKTKRLTPEQIAVKRRKIWVMIAKKEIPKAQKQKVSARKEILSKLKKLAKDSQRECKQGAVQSQKIMKEAPARARRLCREMQVYWKRFEKVEKEHRKRAEKEAQEQKKMDLEIREMKRQQRKLNFLITQTELYAHFMARKMTGEREGRQKEILDRLEETGGGCRDLAERTVEGGKLTAINGDQYDSAAMKSLALRNAQLAYQEHVAKKKTYDLGHPIVKHKPFHQDAFSSLANPDMTSATEQPQPAMFTGKLKGYQLKGMNWLVNLYNQGINGILADEMGLGKTVQSIALLTHLAEYEGIWGPFLVVAPASTLHNWQQEVSRFNTKFKIVPYWGNTQDRKILRKFWNQENINTEDASFHVVITSYQLVIQDVKYFQRIKWHYMILDEAQALKSSSSVRWKILLGFNCRNRLLLTGTPIQNSMAELWALLHFIMPTMFDSHDEFNEWFSKDIESHVEKQSMIDEDQLSRLHMILKPFMLRRVKRDVENELSDKIEILVTCQLTRRQKLLYQAIKNKISIEDLLQSSSGSSTQQTQTSTSSLMNLVMQFRKVCNHPELFERREVRSSFHMPSESFVLPKLLYRDGILSTAVPSRRRVLYNLLYIFHPENVHRSLFASKQQGKIGSCFAFSRFINMSPREMYSVMFAGQLARWLAVFSWLKETYSTGIKNIWNSERDVQPNRCLGRNSFILVPLRTTHHSNVNTSIVLRALVFTSYSSAMYTHAVHHLHYIPETVAHRKIRCRKFSGKLPRIGSPTHRPTLSPPHSPTKSPVTSPKKAKGQHGCSLKQLDLIDVSLLPVHKHIRRPSRQFEDVLTDMPSCFYNLIPQVVTSPRELYCADRSAQWETLTLCRNLSQRNTLLYGNPTIAERVKFSKYYFFPTRPGGLYGLSPKHGFSCVLVPDKETFVSDAGKLYVLDSLLGRLKADGHRVLIYSQMTRMIDLLEEYMIHRKHTYMRLDGSSKISDRRDMVADFQTRSDIFVFLLSTRAGGLGINLTAADTVIFYDSDWNPTVDQQAMDRAHRLGQTKQVTVYRLICKGTIEERILQRAKEKSEIQRMVISGGNYRPDSLKPKEVVSLLLDDDEMERKLRQKQEEKVRREELDKQRKRDKYYSQKKSGTASPCATPGPGGEIRTPKKRGRPPKRKLPITEENNVTIPASATAVTAQVTLAEVESTSSTNIDSPSAAASPQSVISLGSEVSQPFGFSGLADDSSNDALVIVDDQPSSSSVSAAPSPTPAPAKRGTGRPRGRPKGSGLGRRPRGRGSVQKAIAAAEMAAKNAGKSAAFAAYGYNFAGTPAVRLQSNLARPASSSALSSMNQPSPASQKGGSQPQTP